MAAIATVKVLGFAVIVVWVVVAVVIRVDSSLVDQTPRSTQTDFAIEQVLVTEVYNSLE